MKCIWSFFTTKNEGMNTKCITCLFHISKRIQESWNVSHISFLSQTLTEIMKSIASLFTSKMQIRNMKSIVGLFHPKNPNEKSWVVSRFLSHPKWKQEKSWNVDSIKSQVLISIIREVISKLTTYLVIWRLLTSSLPKRHANQFNT